MIITQVQDLLKVKDRIKELELEKEMLLEEITTYLENSGEESLLFDLDDNMDEVITVEKKYRLVDKLDKEALSLEVQISQNDMKTPYDWSKLTEQGKITPNHISKHTHPENSWSVKVARKKKAKPKKADI